MAWPCRPSRWSRTAGTAWRTLRARGRLRAPRRAKQRSAAAGERAWGSLRVRAIRAIGKALHWRGSLAHRHTRFGRPRRRRYTARVPARARIAIPLALIALVIAVAAVVWFARRSERAAATPGPELHTAVPLAALEHASGWLDTAPWTADSLAGKSVLLVVWSD